MPIFIADIAKQLDDILGFLGVHAGRRLIEEQQQRVGRQGPGDFQPALGPVGQILGQFVADICRGRHSSSARDGLLFRLRLLLFKRRQCEQGRQGRLLEMNMHADQDILDDRHIGKEADVLEGAGDAAGGDLIRPQPDQRSAVEAGSCRRPACRCRSGY